MDWHYHLQMIERNEENQTKRKKEARRREQKEADERQNQATAYTLFNKNKSNGRKGKENVPLPIKNC